MIATMLGVVVDKYCGYGVVGRDSEAPGPIIVVAHGRQYPDLVHAACMAAIHLGKPGGYLIQQVEYFSDSCVADVHIVDTEGGPHG